MSNLSRRHFLQGIGAFGAASGLSLVPNIIGRAAQAEVSESVGRIFQFQRAGIRFHSYIAPEASVAVTSHIIETNNSLIVIDAQFLQTFAGEFKAYTDSLGKPVEQLILSHAHPDHFLGANQFEGIPFVSTSTIAADVQAYFDAGNLEQLATNVGESEVPSEPRVPEGELTAGELTIDGVTLTLEVVNNAEAPEHLLVKVPDAGVMVLQDLVYNNIHFFPGQDRANWIVVLEELRETFDGYDTIFPGHGLPTTKGEFDSAIHYLTFADELATSSNSAETVITTLQEEFPGYEGNGLLPFWGLFLPA